jgi:hypothetical protein
MLANFGAVYCKARSRVARRERLPLPTTNSLDSVFYRNLAGEKH